MLVTSAARFPFHPLVTATLPGPSSGDPSWRTVTTAKVRALIAAIKAAMPGKLGG